MTIKILGAAIGDGAAAYSVSNFVGPELAKWQVMDTKHDAAGGTTETIYRLIGGVPKYETSLRIGVYDKKTHHNVSGKLSTWVEETDAQSVLTYRPFSITLAWTSEDGPVPNSAYLLQAVLLMVGFFLPSTSTGATVDTDLDNLSYGVTERDYSEVTRT